MQIHPDVHRIDWVLDLGVSLVIVSVPALILLVMSAGSIVLAGLVMIGASFLAGYRFAPRDLWVTWFGAFLLTWGVLGIADCIGAMGSGEPIPGITPWHVGSATLIALVSVVLVPLWAGRLLKRDDTPLANKRKGPEDSL
jgi:hypothetical protein